MSSAENAKLEYEAGQNVSPMGALTDSGDATKFTSSASLWSGRSGYAPEVVPSGLVTGGAVIPAVAAGNDTVDVAALTCNLAGVLTSVGASLDESITRPATAVAKVNSITVTSAGAIAVVAGTDGAGTSFVETRGAAGGPPYIPTDSIEIAQVRVISDTAAPIASSEIFQVPNVHLEKSDYPLWDEDNADASITFKSALPLIHTGDLPKEVYASFAEPIFAEISLASDFVPSENSHSVSSTQVYNATLGSSSTTLNQGSFTAYLNDGVTDGLISLKNEILWFRFTPNRFKTPYILDQGKLGIARTFPADNEIAAACTISAASAATERTS